MGDIFQSGTDRLIYDFMRGSGLSQDPVIGFTSHGTVMQNSAARRFSASDLAAIQTAAGKTDSRGRANAPTSLGQVALNVRIYTNSENCLVNVSLPSRIRSAATAPSSREPAALMGHSNEWARVVRAVAHARATNRPLLITGETGTGKTSLAMNSPYGSGPVPAGVAVVDAGSLEIIGARRWFERVRRVLNENMNLVLSNIEVLEKRQLTGLRAMLRASPQLHRVTMTATAAEPTETEPFALTFGAHLVHLPPLRDHLDDIEELWHGFARCERPYAALGPDAGALAVLKRYTWPGNLHELQTTVAHALGRRLQGAVTVTDLPTHIRNSRSQGLMEQAEQGAIHRALLATGGNRTHAAEMLGISRATIYRKAKSFGIRV